MLRFGISVSIISSPVRLGYLLLNVSTSHSLPPRASSATIGSGLSFTLAPRNEAGLVGDPWTDGGFADPPVCKAFGLGARGGGPEGARTLIAGGADEDGAGGGILGRPDGLGYARSCWPLALTGLRATGGRLPLWSSGLTGSGLPVSVYLP